MTTKNEIRSSFAPERKFVIFAGRSRSAVNGRRFDKGLDTAVSLGSYARPPPRFACDVRRTIY